MRVDCLGIIIMGMFNPNATDETDVTGVSSIPEAILLMVFAVAGATNTKSVPLCGVVYEGYMLNFSR